MSEAGQCGRYGRRSWDRRWSCQYSAGCHTLNTGDVNTVVTNSEVSDSIDSIYRSDTSEITDNDGVEFKHYYHLPGLPRTSQPRYVSNVFYQAPK